MLKNMNAVMNFVVRLASIGQGVNCKLQTIIGYWTKLSKTSGRQLRSLSDKGRTIIFLERERGGGG